MWMFTGKYYKWRKVQPVNKEQVILLRLNSMHSMNLLFNYFLDETSGYILLLDDFS